MTIRELKDNFTYDAYTGELIRTTRKNSNGSLDKDGYLIIKFKGKQYKAHRLCWFFIYGKFPKDVIDHIDGNKLNNSIRNLRDVTQAENTRNVSCRGYYIDNATNGLKAKYTVKANGKSYRFRTEDEAIEFRKKHDLENGFIRRTA